MNDPTNSFPMSCLSCLLQLIFEQIKHCPSLAEEVSLNAPFAMNIRASAKSDVQRSLARSNKAVDKERWAMPAFIINAVSLGLGTMLIAHICEKRH